MTAAEPHGQDWTAGPTSRLLGATGEKYGHLYEIGLMGPRVHGVGFGTPSGMEQLGQVGSDRLKITVEVLSRGHKIWK